MDDKHQLIDEYICVGCSHARLQLHENIVHVAHIRLRAEDSPTNHGWVKEADTFWMCPGCIGDYDNLTTHIKITDPESLELEIERLKKHITLLKAHIRRRRLT